MQLSRIKRLLEGKTEEELIIDKLKKKYANPITSDMSKEIDAGIEEEKEHENLYSFLLDYMELKEVDFPMSETEFYEWIAAVHLKEDLEYYSKLKAALKKKQGDNDDG